MDQFKPGRSREILNYQNALFGIFILSGIFNFSCNREPKNQFQINSTDGGKGEIQEADYLPPLLQKAESENKNLFLLLGSKGCTWCRKFENYHQNPGVKEILEKYLLIVSVDVIATKPGKVLYKKYWKPGMPAWVILRPDGSIIEDSDFEKNGMSNIGYPYTPGQMDYYCRAVQKAADGLTASEMEILKTKLAYYGSKN